MVRSRVQRVRAAQKAVRGHHKRKHAAFKKHEAAIYRRMRAVKNKLPGRGAGFWGSLWNAGKKKAKEIAGEVVTRGKAHLKQEVGRLAGEAQERLVGVANHAKQQLHGHYQKGKARLTQHAQKFERTARSHAKRAESGAKKATSSFFGSLFGF